MFISPTSELDLISFSSSVKQSQEILHGTLRVVGEKTT